MLKVFRDVLLGIVVDVTVRYVLPNLVSALPYAWMLVSVWFTWDVLHYKPVRGSLIRFGSKWQKENKMIFYILFASLGALLFAVYWFGINKALAAAAKPAVSSSSQAQVAVESVSVIAKVQADAPTKTISLIVEVTNACDIPVMIKTIEGRLRYSEGDDQTEPNPLFWNFNLTSQKPNSDFLAPGEIRIYYSKEFSYEDMYKIARDSSGRGEVALTTTRGLVVNSEFNILYPLFFGITNFIKEQQRTANPPKNPTTKTQTIQLSKEQVEESDSAMRAALAQNKDLATFEAWLREGKYGEVTPTESTDPERPKK